ncbi:hypothetical protein SADUNF_Sadunf04G0110500 [Salix dunnii]|uniref:Disease resistance R13L4/SHOC-2-like LRR domain-containing protein n=1 Tax=Salix dunnii TaxID=1413687 RepID=A0A835K9B8_9ROSI|nr:hypothetical protein SADUNF_Sadunf04G0110500 [Salix dunnii]
MVDQKIVLALKFLLLVLFFESTFEQQQQERLSSPIERAALLELRSSLGLRSKDWPMKADNCSVWNGIKCENGSVSEINISGFRRTRLGSQNPQFRVDSLVNLTRLKSFNASGFYLPGSIPDWFGQRLVSLQVLDLSSCLISNAIPGSLGNLTSLTGLYLYHNNFTGMIPSNLGLLAGLSVLDLSANMFTGSIPVSFGSLQNLTRLDISMNLLSGPIPLAIGMLSKLQYLNLSRNDLSSSIPPQLGDLSNLADFDCLNSCVGIKGLMGQGVKPTVISWSISNAIPGSLGNLTSLTGLYLYHNNFTGMIPSNLGLLAGLSVLDLSANMFTGSIPVSFGSLQNLTRLDISMNLLSGPIPLAIGMLSKLQYLNLSRNDLSSSIPPQLGDLSNLADFDCLNSCGGIMGLMGQGVKPTVISRSIRWSTTPVIMKSRKPLSNT